jgi:hypothetical protein
LRFLKAQKARKGTKKHKKAQKSFVTFADEGTGDRDDVVGVDKLEHINEEYF